MIQTMKNIAGNIGLALVREKNFNRPIGWNQKGIGHFAVVIAGNAFPGENRNVGDYGSAAIDATAASRRVGAA